MTETGTPWTLPDDASPAVWDYAHFLAGEIPNTSGLMFNAMCALSAGEFLLHPEHFDWLLPADQGGQLVSSAPALTREEAASLHRERSLDLPLMLSFRTFLVAHAMVIDQYNNVYSNASPNSHQLQLRRLLLTELQRAVRALRFIKLSCLAGCDRAGVGSGGLDNGDGLLEYLQGKFAAEHLPTPAPKLWVDAVLA